MTSIGTTNNSNPSSDEDKLGFWGTIKSNKALFLLFVLQFAVYPALYYTGPQDLTSDTSRFFVLTFIFSSFMFHPSGELAEQMQDRVRIFFSRLFLITAVFIFFAQLKPEVLLSASHTVSTALISDVSLSDDKTMIETDEGQRFFVTHSIFTKGDKVVIDAHQYWDGSNLKTSICLRELCREATPVE